MRILDLGEAGYEGQSEAQRHYFYIDGDYDQDRGITDYDCDEITKQLVGMGLQAHCQADETRQGVVQIDTYSGRTTVQDGLAKAGYEADYVPSPVNMAIEQAVLEAPTKFTKADFDENESKNYHTENGVELAKAFGTPEEIESMEQVMKNHYSRGHILPDEIEARNAIVNKYLPMLESQQEAMEKMSEGNLGPGDLELLKPMVDMDPKVLPIYAKNIIKKYPHLADNVKRMLPQNEEVVDERELTKSEEDKKEDIVKGMKKDKAGFKERYGKDAEAVMYATATKLAKNEDVNEDFMDDRKYQSLEELRDKLVDIEKHIKRLGIMDGAESWEGKTPTGTGDIHDQLTSMYKSIEGLQGAVGRALKVVPGQDNPDVQKFNQQYGIKQEDEINELDIKKNFQNIANKVGSTLSSIVKDKPVQKTNNKKFGNGSIAQKINWGGKYNEQDELNELDLFAPKTDYIKTPDGQFYKIEYRNTGTVTGGAHGKNDKASFVSVNPASDKEVSALNLDDKIAKNDIHVHQGHEYQGGTPSSDRDIKVYNYGTDDYDEEVPNNAKMKLIKVMTTEAEKKKKSELGTKIRSWREQKADMKKKIEASKPGDKK